MLSECAASLRYMLCLRANKTSKIRFWLEQFRVKKYKLDLMKFVIKQLRWNCSRVESPARCCLRLNCAKERCQRWYYASLKIYCVFSHNHKELHRHCIVWWYAWSAINVLRATIYYITVTLMFCTCRYKLQYSGWDICNALFVLLSYVFYKNLYLTLILICIGKSINKSYIWNVTMKLYFLSKNSWRRYFDEKYPNLYLNTCRLNMHTS